MKTIFDFDFEALSIFKVLGKFGPGIIQKTITGLFPLTWQDGIGGSLVDYSLNGSTAYSGSKNQLVQNGNFASADGWDVNGGTGTLSVSNNIATVSNGGEWCGIRNYKTLIATHKYYYSILVNFSSNGQFGINNMNGLNESICEISANTWTLCEKISEALTTREEMVGWFSNVSQTSAQFKNAMIVDLTALVGSGNEPTTTAAAKSLIATVMNHGTALDYYPYDSGTPYAIGVGDYGGKKNQLVDYANGSFYKDSATCTVSGRAVTMQSQNLAGRVWYVYESQKNHKYFICAYATSSVNGSLKFELSRGWTGNYFQLTANTKTRIETILTASNEEDGENRLPAFFINGSNDYELVIEDIMVFDLTALFPNETITDVSTAKARIAEVMGESDYYQYDAGTDYYGIPEVVTSGARIGFDEFYHFNIASLEDPTIPASAGLFQMYQGTVATTAKFQGGAFVDGFTNAPTKGIYNLENMELQLGNIQENVLLYIRNTAWSGKTGAEVKADLSGKYLYYQRATDDSWYIQHKTAYRNAQLTEGQSISMLQDNLPHFDNLPTGYLQMGVDTAVAPSGGSVTYKSRSVSI